jgi:pimeloyl-ACP methyl ester carboxylesterase
MAYVFVGGFGDSMTDVVADYQKTYVNTHSGSVYFGWGDTDAIVTYLDKLPKDEQINLIGHSYGGDTAGCIVARYKRKSNVLVTIDPVGHTSKNTMQLIKGNCTVWVDVNAKPEGRDNLSDALARVGSRWGDDPKGIATFYIEAPFDHERFTNLMNSPEKNGQTAAMILEQYSAAARLPTVKTDSSNSATKSSDVSINSSDGKK